MRSFFSYIMIILCIFTSSSMFSQTTASSSMLSDFLTVIMNEKDDANSSLQGFSFFDDNFNFLSYKKKYISIGVNTFFEEDLPDTNLKFSDFFVYNCGFNLSINRLQFSLFVENFFNLNSKELSIAPAYIENNNTLVYLEHDTPSMIHLSLVYSF